MPDPEDYKDIINIIRILLPRLKKMAAKTKNPFDDIVVNLISSLVGKE